MATTLSFGYIKPVTGDRGSVFFPALEDNITQLNNHTHNGTNSANLSPSAISTAGFTSAISAASWGSATNGIYTQSITVPAGVTEINNYNVYFYNSSTYERLLLSMTRTAATTYDVSINDNTINLVAVYK